MIIVLASQFYVYLSCLYICLALSCLITVKLREALMVTAIKTFLSLYLLSIWYRHDLLQTSWSEIDCRRAEAEERRDSVFVGGSRSLAGGVRREETSPYLGLYQEVHMMNTWRKYLALHQLELCSQENVKSWKIFRQNLWKRVLLGHEHINFKSIWAQCTSVSAI